MLDTPKMTPLQIIQAGLPPHTLASDIYARLDDKALSEIAIHEIKQSYLNDRESYLADKEFALEDSNFDPSEHDLAEYIVERLDDLTDIVCDHLETEYQDPSTYLQDVRNFLDLPHNTEIADVAPTYEQALWYSQTYDIPMDDLADALETSLELNALIIYLTEISKA